MPCWKEVCKKSFWQDRRWKQERHGISPGDLEEKLLPYLRPLYDAMDEVLGPVEARKLIETGVVEIAPLAYMRGRTLRCFALLDEAQNATSSQMMMFLTRLERKQNGCHWGSYPDRFTFEKESGLLQAKKVLSNVRALFS